MQTLTRAEEEIMQIIWKLERCTVSDIRDVIEQTDGAKPPHSTVSTMVRILEEKGFLSHKAYGRTYEYFPSVQKADYTKRSLNKLVTDYFDGSVNRLVSFLMEEEKLNVAELTKLLEKLDD
ncbi:MAG: BlaI/MecI/CopY family transcriptional regulator [Saprospiraceae bacterium]|nr:BlaI/MecI/CopY family transcriptional regulator [Saprospiraceae bacterium]